MGFWDSFNSSTLELPDSSVDPNANLAYDVVEAFLGDVVISNRRGGALKYLDIKRMDAISLINLSLMEEFADGTNTNYTEIMINGNGEVVFKEIEGGGNSVTNVYHSLATSTYINPVVGVMVHGGKPLVERRDTDWVDIWQDDNGKYMVTTLAALENNCLAQNFNRHASVVFPDPHLNSKYNDGIDNLYEITDANMWDNPLGYATRRYFQGLTPSEDVSIAYSQQCSIPIELPDPVSVTDKLYRRKIAAQEDESCLPPDEIDGHVAVHVEIPEVLRFEFGQGVNNIKIDNFIRISNVYVVGKEMYCYGRPKTITNQVLGPNEEISQDDIEIVAAINDVTSKVFTLSEGIHYIVSYRQGDFAKDPYLVFANNSMTTDDAEYGDDTTFYIDPNCPYNIGLGEVNRKTLLESKQEGQVVFPIDGKRAIWVEKIIAVAELETPCVSVHDPAGEAGELIEKLVYQLKPLVLVDRPAPIGYCNGTSRVIDLKDSRTDNDPTTAQDLVDTDLELALEEMVGGGLSLTLSFLMDDDYEAQETLVSSCAQRIYDFVNEDVSEYTHICGPECNPQLGDFGPNGGVINSIDFSYNDGNSYTVTVNEGPRSVGTFAEVSDSLASKATEDRSTMGVIVQDAGTHVHYKVRLDDLGERIAINCTPDILRVGDRVNVTVHNNPVEG